jgi:hypothetical protein
VTLTTMKLLPSPSGEPTPPNPGAPPGARVTATPPS